MINENQFNWDNYGKLILSDYYLDIINPIGIDLHILLIDTSFENIRNGATKKISFTLKKQINIITTD